MLSAETNAMPNLDPTPDDPQLARPRPASQPRAASDFEQQWLRDYLNGDESGFTSLYHRYRSAVYRYFLAHCPMEACNRLYLQTWANFLQNAAELGDETPAGAAIFAEAHHLLLEGYRERDKSLILSFADGVVETVGTPGADTAIDHPDLLKLRLGELPPAWREALQVYLETGFDGDTLAYALHVNRETARSRLKRAFAAWRKLWPDTEDTVDGSLRNVQPWLMRYRTQVSAEPAAYLDTRVLRQADWNTRWLPQLGRRIARYWHIGLTALVTGIGVFGYLYTLTAPPQFRLEVPQASAPAAAIASAPAASIATAPMAAASAPAASAASAAAASASATTLAAASAATASATSASAATASALAAKLAGAVKTAPKPAVKPKKTAKAASAAVAAPASAATASTPQTSGNTGDTAASTAQATPASADEALERIRASIRNGHLETSQQLLKRFHEQYPGHPIPPDLQ